MRHGRPVPWAKAGDDDDDGRRLSGWKAFVVVALRSLPLLAIAELGDEQSVSTCSVCIDRCPPAAEDPWNENV
jgi:hypothetical protein